MPYADLISMQNSESMEIITLLKVIKDAVITLIEGFLVENPLYQPNERGKFTWERFTLTKNNNNIIKS